MDPIVGLFPRRFLWKLNQTEPVRARKHISSWDFLLRVDSSIFLDILPSCNQILITSLPSSTPRKSESGSSVYIKTRLTAF